MSGSPVYVDGRLLGAVAFGFTAAPSPIGGLTPAEEMVKLLDLPASAKAAASERLPDVVAVPPEFQSLLSPQDAAPSGATLQRLPLPLGVSGLNPQRLAMLQSDVTKAGLPLVAHAGCSQAAPTETTPFAEPTVGGNFVAALSYGDVTAAGTGTTTAVCDGTALAFGHPLQFAGAVGYGASDASVLTVVKDTSFGSFKFARIGAPFGTVDQDRLAGVRGSLGSLPDTSQVTASITAVDSDRSRTGRTDVTDDRFMPGLAFASIIASYDSTFDEIGDGSATSTWRITGTRAGGATFELERSNRWSSQFDIASDPAFDIASALDQLLNNPFEKVGFDEVRFSSDVQTAVRQASIVDALVSVDGGPFERADAVVVPAGSTLRVQVVLQSFQSTSNVTAELEVMVPQDAAGRSGSLQVSGGAGSVDGAAGPGVVGEQDPACLFAEHGCATVTAVPPEALDTLLDDIRNRPRNDDVTLTLTLDAPPEGGEALTESAVERQDQVVTGFRGFSVQVTE
jgi:hypothetical protein